jgi:TP901 family phage tail tape measure protein
MASDVKIIIKAVADLTGISRAVDKVRDWAKEHKVSAAAIRLGLRGLAAAAKASFSAIAAAGSAALKGLGKGWDFAKKGALGVGVGLAASVREFYSWNSEASRAWALMDIGREEFVAMRREIAAMSAELGVAKSDLGKGWKLAAGSGVEDNEIIPFLRTAAKVAVTDGSDIETAINGITNVLNAFGYASSDVGRVTDMLFNNVDRGKSSFQALASHISQAAPTASALGVGLDQILAAEAHLSKQGYATSTAYVAIRNAMLALSEELGDGWAKTMTFQEALVKVVEAAKGSETALGKIFGTRNVGAVLAMTGAQAKRAAEELDLMRSRTGSLNAAFTKVDSQIQHWPRLWQSIRLLVSDIGEALDTALRPAAEHVSRLLVSLRDGGGFGGLVKLLGDGAADAAAKLTAAVQTAVDLLGKASLGGIISGAVNALVDTAVTLLAKGLRSLGTVMVALAKVFSGALAADFMKMDIWGRDEEKGARRAALRNLKNLTDAQAEAFGVPAEFRERDTIMTPEQHLARGERMQAWAGGLTLDQAAAVATASKDQDIDRAIAAAFESFAASRGRMEALGGRVVGGLSRRTGVDIPALYSDNLGRVTQALSAAPSAAPAPAQQAAAPAAAPRADIAAIKADADATVKATAENTVLMQQVWADMRRETQKQNAALKDIAARGKHPGG